MSITSPEPATLAVPAHEVRTVVIRPRKGMGSLNLGDLWTYRELIGFMTWRDVIVRYKQTFLGVAWAILRPFLSMVVFTIFFGKPRPGTLRWHPLPDLFLHRVTALGAILEGAFRCQPFSRSE